VILNHHSSIINHTAQPENLNVLPLQGKTGFSWLEEEMAYLTKDKTVIIDADAVENLRILEQGSYELDLPSLMKGDPLVIRSDKDVYYVKLPNPKKVE
jgi:predicted  nucleic acid-binding Zn-ribbon protein